MKTGQTTLHRTPKGETVLITEIPDGRSKAQLIRLGIVKGVLVRCLERLPGGTVVIQKNRQELAIGVSLARLIFVSSVSPATARVDRKKKK